MTETHYNCIFQCNNPMCACHMIVAALEGPLTQTIACPKKCGGAMVFVGIKR